MLSSHDQNSENVPGSVGIPQDRGGGGAKGQGMNPKGAQTGDLWLTGDKIVWAENLNSENQWSIKSFMLDSVAKK